MFVFSWRVQIGGRDIVEIKMEVDEGMYGHFFFKKRGMMGHWGTGGEDGVGGLCRWHKLNWGRNKISGVKKKSKKKRRRRSNQLYTYFCLWKNFIDIF